MLRWRKTMALIMLSMGVGMLIVLIVPWWGFILAASMVVCGFWNLFL